MAIAAGTFSLAIPTAAEAQELIRRKPWSLFDMFRSEPRRPRYENSDRYPGAPKATRRKVRKAERPTRKRAALLAPAAPEVTAVEKAADARAILIVGDFLASGMAEGLTSQFAQEAGFRIVDASNGSSGFVRDDVFDWVKEMPALVEREKPAAIVVMMGSNDRQAIRLSGNSIAPGTPAWSKAYEARAAALGDLLEGLKTPYLWVGMPAFKSTKMTSDMLAFNDVYKASAEANKGEFVDIWDGFVDETGAFVSTGPDVNGQPAKLRGADGINLSKAGKAKVAFYVDKPLRKMLGLGTPGAVVPLSPGASGPQPIRPAPDRTAPMSLNDPELDGGVELLGGTVQPPQATPASGPPSQPSPTPRLPGVTQPSPGRIDDYSSSTRQPDVPQPASNETTTAIRR